jgi:dTDP-glucose 4,6-dehydratase
MGQSGRQAVVTGGAGFIGSHLCDALLAQGLRVICVDNMSTGDPQNISGALQNPSFSLQEQDVCEPLDCQADFVFHMASPASPVDYANMQVETMLANSLGTLNCLELALKCGSRMLLASTSEVYGDPQVSPQNEGYFGHVNPVGSRSCYDESKRFAEALCKAYQWEHRVENVIISIFNTYGSRMRRNDGRVIPNFVCQSLEGKPLTIYGDGSQTRSFCHVGDMVDGLIKAMFLEEAGGEVINMGNPEEMRIIDLAGRIRDKVDSASEMVFETLPADDPIQRKPDISKAMSLLGWAPATDLESGLDDVIDWFKGSG